MGIVLRPLIQDCCDSTHASPMTMGGQGISLSWSCKPWACMYSLPWLPSYISLRWVYKPFCQNMGVTANNYI